MDIEAIDEEGSFCYNFKKMNYSVEQYKIFMRKTGIFNLIENRIIGSLVDYVTGIETGLDSNGRKNRGGHLMENLVESYIQKAGFVKGITYFKEMYIHAIEKKWGIDLSSISNQGKAEKRFDFVVKTPTMVYGIETNFMEVVALSLTKQQEVTNDNLGNQRPNRFYICLVYGWKRME